VLPEDSTLDDVRRVAPRRAGVLGRRVALTAMAVVVLVAATGWLGVRAETVRVRSAGYELSLTYPRVARAGLDIPWELRLVHAGGFSEPITVAVSASYFDIFEYQDLHPEAMSERSDAKFVYLTFAPPPAGDVFTVSLDTYVQPASQIGRHAETEVVIGGQTVAHVSYSTWLVP
jgi:hypothetical protein